MFKLFSFLPAALFSKMPILADAAAAPENNLMRTVSFVGIVLAFFYLILWRPEQKRRKTMQNLRNSLKPGDKVTAMGIIGEIAEIKENSIVLKVDGAKIEMIKEALTKVHQENEAEVKKEASVEAKQETAAV